MYEYKHQLEYKNVIDELTNIRIKCFFYIYINVNIVNMVYRNHDHFCVKCLHTDNLCTTPKRILNTITSNKYHLLKFYYYYKYL